MKLFSAIFFSTILGLILFYFNFFGIIIAFGIIAGSLFYGISKLLSINEKLAMISKHLDIKEEKVEVTDEEIERELESFSKNGG
ncbi:D-ribose transporter ATP-binding protein [Oceanobacillus picturae]|uniref:D-ribose transporter ATP-binding protein n=1 Tax=Oceanobacillus picturae TaxID=171693 RepID=A0A0U9HCU4_9BACI|nr:hypothetical protein [Oceanobacillus picturae]GAQ19089.1 D-ribose transporter ATP-binding protein [Oceanobacillus picturae]